MSSMLLFLNQILKLDIHKCILCLFLTIVIYIPEPLIIIAPTPRGYYISLIFNLAFIYSVVYLGLLIHTWINKINKWISYSYTIICHILIYGYSFITLFLYKNFHLTLNAYAFQLLSETTEKETSGFVSTYCANSAFLKETLLYLTIFLFELLLIRFSRNLKSYKWENKLSIAFYLSHYLVVFFMFSELRFFTPTYAYSQVFYEKADRWIIRTGLWNLSMSIYQFRDLKSQIDRAIKSQDLAIIRRASSKSKNIVLIIGESYNKHHSSLYGYGLETNPKLSKEQNLYVFDDVITHYNVTTHSFKYFMSMASVGDTIEWCDAPLFPQFFKESGYKVVFYSNQFFPSKENSHYEESSGFMCHPEISKRQFSSFNYTWHAYDMDLISQYIEERHEHESNSLNFVIFHLNGQHVPARDKYPQEEIYFSIKDINRRDLTESENQEIADYDNACRYNDKVVDSIIDLYRDKDAIVLYFADHGEEANDYRSKVGRSFDFEEMGIEGLRCQLDIPFMIFMSDSYQESHPDVVESVRTSVHKPFMIDDLPHMLLFLAGIDTPWYNESRNLLSSKFDESRKRIIYSTAIDYDEKTK